MRFVRDRRLTDQRTVRVETVNNLLELREQSDGRVTVDMNVPVFDLARVPFEPRGLAPREVQGCALWPLAVAGRIGRGGRAVDGQSARGAARADVDSAPVATQGPLIEHDAHFPRKVNAGFMQVVDRGQIRLRVYERDAGETLACGTGACAAVVAGIRLGLLDARVDVHTRGGVLTIEWAGGDEPCADDRAGGDGVRRRDRAVSGQRSLGRAWPAAHSGRHTQGRT